jgi:hypothetical protein
MMDDFTCPDHPCPFDDMGGWGRGALEDIGCDFADAHRRYHEIRAAAPVIERSPDGRFAGRGGGTGCCTGC